MARPLDLTGQRFTRLTVVGLAPHKDSQGNRLWLCQCDCGNQSFVPAGRLRSGMTRSCSCIQKEKAGARTRKHGASRTRAYRAYRAMIKRCERPNNVDYKWYGGRGITVCERWHDYANFLADMGERPSEKHFIERIDNDGPYCPENCTWATREEQQANTRQAHLITWQGKTMNRAAWARELGMPPDRLRTRLKLGWPIDRAFLEPLKKNQFG